MSPTDETASTLDQLLFAARELGLTQLSCGVNEDCVAALVAAGAVVTRTVIRHGVESPYVIESAQLARPGLVVQACREPRPASPGEVRALESGHAYLVSDDHKAVELPNAD